MNYLFQSILDIFVNLLCIFLSYLTISREFLHESFGREPVATSPKMVPILFFLFYT